MTNTFLTHEERDLFSELLELDPALLDNTEDASDEAEILKSQLEDKSAIEKLAKFVQMAKQELEVVEERKKKLDNAKKNLDRKIEFFKDQIRILVSRHGEKTKTGTFAYTGEFFKCTVIKQFKAEVTEKDNYTKGYKVTVIVDDKERADSLRDSFEDSEIEVILDKDKVKEHLKLVQDRVKDTTAFQELNINNDEGLIITQSLQLRIT
jgi:hypothetical protein